ncbi:hypothetical protein [Deinococcus kurensis]|uniref:hypothetical protein n=1 Tax=Deinococcus kurensis TaxID=2662757 RepID=UPI0012D362D8|nr:hypothetical protein [Deinococcus kurensis]
MTGTPTYAPADIVAVHPQQHPHVFLIVFGDGAYYPYSKNNGVPSNNMVDVFKVNEEGKQGLKMAFFTPDMAAHLAQL